MQNYSRTKLFDSTRLKYLNLEWIYINFSSTSVDYYYWSAWFLSFVQLEECKKKYINGEAMEQNERFFELFWLDLETSEMPPLTLDQCLVRFLAIFGYHTWPLYGVPWRKKSGRILVHDPVTKLFYSNVQSSRGDYSHTRGGTINGSPRSDQLKMARRASYNKTRDTSSLQVSIQESRPILSR